MTIVHLDDEDVTVGELIAPWVERVRGIAIETTMLSEGVEGKITSHDYIGFCISGPSWILICSHSEWSLNPPNEPSWTQ
jgi:hypothetical protein